MNFVGALVPTVCVPAVPRAVRRLWVLFCSLLAQLWRARGGPFRMVDLGFHKARFRSWSDTATLGVSNALHGRQPRLWWVGDSHAAFFAQAPLAPVSRSSVSADAALWLGPRLMYSLQRRGMSLTSAQRWMLQTTARPHVAYSFGEIDCRVFLAREPFHKFRSDEWLIRSLTVLAKHAHANSVEASVLVMPVPMSNIGSDNPDYPRRGTLRDRVVGHEWFCQRVAALASQYFPDASVLDLRPILAMGDGTFDPTYTHDGTHTNSLGSRLVREATMDLICPHQ